MTFYGLFLAGTLIAAVVAFIVGLISTDHRRAAVTSTAAIGAGYVLLMVVLGLWKASCPGCESFIYGYDSGREEDVYFLLTFGLASAAFVVACVWMGAGIAALGGRARN